jgi:excisionase family DNA binding protein
VIVLDGVEMLDIREAAALVHRTPETVRRWVWSGRLTARRHGNRLLVSREALEQLVAAPAGRRPATAAQPPLSLEQWRALVAAERGAGTLTALAAHPSALDLVLADRRARTEAP